MLDSKSLLSIKPGDSHVGIAYQVDEFTHAWLAVHFIAESHIYPGSMSKMSIGT